MYATVRIVALKSNTMYHVTRLKVRMKMTEIEKRIAMMAGSVNRELDRLADAELRKMKNIWITEDGRIIEIRNHMELDNLVEDEKKKLDDLLRQLDSLIKERDGV